MPEASPARALAQGRDSPDARAQLQDLVADLLAAARDEGAAGRPARLLLTPKDAAHVLSISEKTLWTLNQSGEIPVVRIGRAVRYRVADVVAWIERAKARR